MNHYPLLFGFRDRVVGRGFLAGVAISGRALLIDDEEIGFWMHGVNPGGFAAGGSDIGEAQRAFREEYRKVLFDLAESEPTFEAFRQGVERFFHETSEAYAEEWRQAVEEVRAGKIEATWLEKENADKQLSVKVVRLANDQLEPGANEIDESVSLADASRRAA